MEQERRRFSRVIYPNEAVLHQGDDFWDTCLLDISLSGALVDTPEQWPGRRSGAYRLEFTLPKTRDKISMAVHVVHETPDYLGLEREDIDVDSISNLKRLIAMNLGEDDLVHRELENMLPGGEEDDHEYSATIVHEVDAPSEDDAEPNDMMKP